MIEFVDGVPQIAYTGEAPWHKFGKRVPADLTPEQMAEAAGVNWTVSKVPTYARVNGQEIVLNDMALVRDTDGKILSVVTRDWHEVQNQEAFSFFDDWVRAGEASMETAGSLRGGKIVWALAKLKESFMLSGRDVVDSYLLFSNPHSYGIATAVQSTSVRVVCNNTLSWALEADSQSRVSVHHGIKFKADDVKEQLGVAKEKLAKYKEAAEFLVSKHYTPDKLLQYFRFVFPQTSRKDERKDELSKNASLALSIIEKQPGFSMSPGSYWQCWNAATLLCDHHMGRNEENRLVNSWWGGTAALKRSALKKALELATTS